MIAPGFRPNLSFALPVVRDGVSKEMVFADLLKRRTIVSVYMKNHTPSCDRQVTSLAGRAAEFARTGYDLVAISRDTVGSQVRYAAAKGVGCALVSDPGDRFARAMDSLVEKSMYGKTFIGPARAAYVFDADGTVLAVIEKVDTKDHAGQLLDVIGKL